jgi:hypothetical protein
MKFLKNIEWTPLTILKALGILVLLLIILSFAARFASGGLNRVAYRLGGDGFALNQAAPASMPAVYGGGMAAYDTDVAYEEAASSTKLSLSNIGVPEPVPGVTTGDDAEEYEVTDYSASFETRNKAKECTVIADLKPLDYVIFENANDYDHGCSYRFKVESDRVAEILAIVTDLGPKNLYENTYTIKRQLDDFTSQEEILQNKLDTIDETLTTALDAYDDVTRVATSSGNAEALASVIDSKVNTIERLTQQRINIAAQLERLARNKADQMDRLDYTYFSVNVYENKFIDGEYLRDSWKGAVQQFVHNVNRLVQQLSIGLIGLLLFAARFVVYYFILLFAVKYVWKTTKHIWKK